MVNSKECWVTVGKVSCPDIDCKEGRLTVVSPNGKSYSESCSSCGGKGYLIKYRNTQNGDEVEY